MKSFLVAACLSLLYSQVDGHGWMAQPCPRSTSSPGTAPGTCTVSTGTASTSGPCGKGTTAKTWSATWTQGQTADVAYQRANSHGNTGDTVTLSLSPTSTFSSGSAQKLTNANGGAQKFQMDVTKSAPQSVKVNVPANFPLGPATLQFLWQPTNGGSWYDCADVNIVAAAAANPCDAKPCSDICTPSASGTTYTCSCLAGNVFDGTSKTKCVTLPAPAKVTLIVKGDYNTKAAGGASAQDTFTSALEDAFPSLVGYVNFDVAAYMPSTDTTEVKLEIEAKSTTTTGQTQAVVLTNYIKNPSSIQSFASQYPPVSVQLEGQAVVDAPTSTDAPTSPTTSPTQTGTATVKPTTKSTVTKSPTQSTNNVGAASAVHASFFAVIASFMLAIALW